MSKAIEWIALWIASWFGCGFFPKAPGTAGSLAAVLMAMALVAFAGWRPLHLALLSAALALPAIWAAGVTERRLRRRDPNVVVVDEVLGQWITLAGATTYNWKSWLAAFVLFRLFDILKPYPVGRLENAEGGTGIVADDLMAGIYGALVLFTAGCFNLY